MLDLILAFDNSTLQWFASVRTIPGAYFFIGVSEFGSSVVVGGLALIVMLLLVLYRRFPEVAGLVLAVGGSAAVVEIMKIAIRRPRPGIRYAAFREDDFSFPSGHAAKSMVFYVFLAFVIARTWPPGAWRRAAFIALPFLALLVSFSRIYLGLHYASDVVAGMLLGGVFALAGALITRAIEKRLQNRMSYQSRP